MQVDEQSIKDALATALFTSAGAERMRFAHQTYSGFLAAYYLAKQCGFSVRQKLQLLIHPHDPQGKVVPQLREVATWLASMDPEFRSVLLHREPDLLMRADLASLGQEERRVLVEQLFKHQQAVTHRPIIYPTSAQARNLVYPGLDDLLRRYLRSGVHPYTRVLAVMTAESAGCKSLQEDILETALTAGEEHILRYLAVQALAKLGSPSVIVKLLPLARGQSGKDPDDELRASSLKLLWGQRLIGVDELLECLSHPPQGHSIGQHAGLLLKDRFWDGLAPEESRKTLVWLTNEGIWTWSDSRLISSKRIGYLLMRARNHVDTLDMLEASASLVFKWIERLSHLDDRGDEPTRALIENDTFRPCVLNYIFKHLTTPREQVCTLCYPALPGDARCISGQDIPWILKNLQQASSPERVKWVWLVSQMWQTVDGYVHKNAVLEAAFDILS